ncbi:MAG TPA: hypothetical protein RMG48_02315 [Myxococcales bacterium LLY-WYZ-16_1]|nr:hypothetical protein [Myxococcales bacterium LLY-WYZ-16_1]
MSDVLTGSQQARASLLGALATFVSSSLLVLFPWAWFDSWQRFGFKRVDHVVFGGGTALALVGLAVGFRAYRRYVLRNEARSEAPLLTRSIPILVMAGLSFGGYMGYSVHQQRSGVMTSVASNRCADVLCPQVGDSRTERAACLDAHPRRDACMDEARNCLRIHAAKSSGARRSAALDCLKSRLAIDQPR